MPVPVSAPVLYYTVLYCTVLCWVTCPRARVLHLSVWYRPLAPPCLPVTGLQVGEAEVAVDKFPGAASHGAGR